MDRTLLLSESARAPSDGGTAHLKASEDAGAAPVSTGVGPGLFRNPGGGHPSEALSPLQPRGAEGMASQPAVASRADRGLQPRMWSLLP